MDSKNNVDELLVEKLDDTSHNDVKPVIDNWEKQSCSKNEYSIYEYLKSNTSVLIAVISAVAAIITFFARLAAIIKIKKQLSFWEFQYSIEAISVDGIIFSIMVSILYSLLISVAGYFSYCAIDFGLLIKKHKLKIRYIKKDKKFKSHINDSTRKLIKSAHMLRLIILVCSVFLVFGGSIIYSVISIEMNLIFKSAIIAVLFYIIVWEAIKFFSYRKNINKKQIKRECESGNYESGLTLSLSEIKNKYWKKPKNDFFIEIGLVLIIFGIFFCVSNIIFTNNLYDDKPLQITNIDNQDYIIIYQDSNKYFLEEINTNDDALIVYTNRQRTVNVDNLSWYVKKFNKVIKCNKEVSP